MNIAITGDIGSGKTTAATYLAAKYKMDRVSFAEPVKQIANVVLNDIQIAAHSPLRKRVDSLKQEDAVRKLLQLIGHDLGRELIGPPHIWIDKFLKNHGHRKNVVVDDLRYENESLMLRSRGYKIIRIVRKDVPTQLHPSEQEHERIVPDFIIYPDTKENMYEMLDAIMEVLNV